MSELRGKKLEEWKTERKEDIEERAKVSALFVLVKGSGQLG